MKWELATDQQLMTIANNDKNCPSSLLRGLAEEMIRRNMWDKMIVYSAKLAFHNAEFVIKHRLKIEWQELIQIGHIEIMMQVEKFKTGMRTFNSFVIMCLKAKFMKLNREVMAEKRYSNIGTQDVDDLEEKVQIKIFQSPVNVERSVINKIMLEEGWKTLRENEKQAITLEQQGFSQYEIAERLGVHKRYGNVLLKRAYMKLRKQMGA